MDASQAKQTAEELLAQAQPMRWMHVQAVAEKAEKLGRLELHFNDLETLCAAAWLHDIGYASALVASKFHPLDGARWLRDRGWPMRVANLVANHSCANISAELLGLSADLALFPAETSRVADILTYADMTTGPQGQIFTVTERLNEIAARYAQDTLMQSFVHQSRPILLALERCMGQGRA